MLQIVSRDTDMNLLHMEDFGLHYARTLRLWHENFRRAHGRLAELGYDEYFLRSKEFYLCYREGGFMERTIGTAQLLLAKPAAINPPLLGVSVLKSLANTVLFQCGWFARARRR